MSVDEDHERVDVTLPPNIKPLASAFILKKIAIIQLAILRVKHNRFHETTYDLIMKGPTWYFVTFGTASVTGP